MYKALVSDLSKTILFYAEDTLKGSMNALYKDVKNASDFDFWKYYKVNKRLLDYYESIKEKVSLYVFTSGYLQKDPAIASVLSEIFLEVYNLDDLGADSKEGEAVYKLLAKKLDCLPQEVIFIDDKQENVNAAEAAGMKAIRFEDSDVFYAELRELL